MNGTTFDALDAARTLREAGFENRHAVGADRDTLATKADLAALEGRLTVRLFGGLLAMGSLLVAAMAALKLFA